MKNVFKLFGLITLVAIIGFGFAASLTGCGGDDDNGNGNGIMRTVTFDANGGTVEGAATKAVQVEDGEKVVEKMPTDPVYGSKYFWGWFDKKTQPYGNCFTGTIPITANKTVYARWDDTNPPPQRLIVTFNTNGGTFTGNETTWVIEVYPNETVIPPWANIDGGLMLSGWNSEKNGTGTAFDEDTPVTASLTVYAQWKKPEDMPVKDRWGKWVDDTSTATLVYSVADDGVCSITVGGKVDEAAWKVQAIYKYTAKTDTCYEYTFEAWTQSGTRDFQFQYYYDNDEKVYLNTRVTITDTRTTYTIYGQEIPKGGLRQVEFQCADQLGTFYVKILGIKEYTTGKLTITNFSGSHGLIQNSYIEGGAWNLDNGLELSFSGSMRIAEYGIDSIEKQIKGNTITIGVWEVNYDEETFAPFFGNITVAEGNLSLKQINFDERGWIGDHFFTNKVPITFTNGNATINFGTQMEFVWFYDPFSPVSPGSPGSPVSSGGTFTLTGIPSEYNGKYAYLAAGLDHDDFLLGAESINMSRWIYTFPRISNGSVSIPLWRIMEWEWDSIRRYSGNNTVDDVMVYICATSTLSEDASPDLIQAIRFNKVGFSEGNATKSWNSGELVKIE